jgi:hypothetical protein
MFQSKVVEKIKTNISCVCEISEDSNATLIYGWAVYFENHKLRSCRQKAPLFRRADAQGLSLPFYGTKHCITLHPTNIMHLYIKTQKWKSS